MTGPQRNPPGAAGKNFVANTERLRQAQGLSYEALAARLAEAGHPVNQVSLSRMGRGERRAGVDDLVAFAEVLGVTASDLLAPPESGVQGHTLVRAVRALAARAEALVAAPGDPQVAGQFDRAIRRVQLEAEELTASATARTHGRTYTAAGGTHDHGNPAAGGTP